jgi:hypothetical protein
MNPQMVFKTGDFKNSLGVFQMSITRLVDGQESWLKVSLRINAGGIDINNVHITFETNDFRMIDMGIDQLWNFAIGKCDEYIPILISWGQDQVHKTH